ncbi:MAG: hypothetical protein GXY44_15170 [Phycisphaerales bacterium]|nr:hypothetical protein [Phycisphaerales bacterium]
MNRYRPLRLNLGSLVPLLLVALVAGCPEPVDPCASVKDDLEEHYLAAIQEAAKADPESISRDLTAINEYNPNLIWDASPDARRVLVVTWTSWDGYDEWVGQDVTLSREVWVTVVPELREFSAGETSSLTDRELRIRQLLGLPGDDLKDRFVELWVTPADLFRPSPDPEITDREAGLDWPQGGGYLTVADEYVSWFNFLVSTSYGPDGYPWTRLGYTFDWGNPCTNFGLSEFVIRDGAVVGVHAVTDNATYLLGS